MSNAFTETFTMVDYLTELIKSREWCIANNRDTDQLDRIIEETRNTLLKQNS